MCGIAGVLRQDGKPVGEQLLRAMTSILAHRGPDGEGYLIRRPVGLGHRRLAIIDLVSGHQPMANEDGSVALVFNGEIYNFRELRRELEVHGHVFRTTSDSEVILRAYEAYGVECLGRLRGMFAFAIWDGRRRRLFLARDRVGIKPLVYAWDGRRLLFASELKAILQDPSVPRDLDWEALRDYLTFSYIPSPRTIFRGIRKLAPASYLVLDLDRGEPEVRRYWDLQFLPDETRTEAEWVEGLRWRLQDSVRSHLVSDVPIGAFLSGGMDSSTVVALMSQEVGEPVRTFSIGFDEADFDELRYARAVARRYGTDHYEFVVKPDALEAMPRLMWQFDEPFADSSAVPTYYVSKITREHVTVALSGDGGDENFAGYGRYLQALRWHERLDHPLGAIARPLFRLAASLLAPGARGRGYLELLGSEPTERYFRMVTYQRTGTLRRLLTPDAQAHVAPIVTPALFRQLVREGRASDYLATLQYLDVRTYLPEDILTKIDRTSMLVSLETRVPLLDHLLMEYVARMPSRLKLRNGAGKAVLKGVMAEDLPSEILGRRKMGFGVPIGTWFRRELAGYAREILVDRRTRQRGLINAHAVEALLEEHRTGKRERSSQIWLLLCLEEWARRWWDR
ncbi:MAG: asparagine synthase (glutamine-hydrolyzing) [Candidatus Rokubacteria bacterium]|nr:asparagine synthase (glutamine-hydrolyzing) [Candidatus Rokubacteria bacterium]